MARRGGRVRRYASRGRSFVRRGRSAGGKFGGIIPPLLGGVADGFLSGYSVPIIGKLPTGVGSALVGWFMHEPITRNIGLYQIGASIPGMFGGSQISLGHVGQV